MLDEVSCGLCFLELVERDGDQLHGFVVAASNDRQPFVGHRHAAELVETTHRTTQAIRGENRATVAERRSAKQCRRGSLNLWGSATQPTPWARARASRPEVGGIRKDRREGAGKWIENVERAAECSGL